MTYIGATGLDIFDDTIEETSNILVRDLSNSIIKQVGYSSNYTEVV